jgi:hypothetical protein
MAARAQNLEAGITSNHLATLTQGVRNLKMRPHGTAVVPGLIGRLWTERSRPLICLLRNGQARVWCGNLGNTLRSLSLDTVPISAIRCWGWMLLRRSASLERVWRPSHRGGSSTFVPCAWLNSGQNSQGALSGSSSSRAVIG